MASENVSNQYIILEYGGDGNADCAQLNQQVRDLKSQGDISQAKDIIRQNYKCFEGTSHWEELNQPKIKPLEHPDGSGSIGSNTEFCRFVRHNYSQYKKFGMDSLADQLLQYDYCNPKEGHNPPAPSLEPNPKSLQYGDVKQGTTKTKKISISNTGKGELIIDSVTVTGVHPHIFSVVENNTSNAIQPGGSADVRVKFAPESIGKKTATLTILSNTNRGEYSITLDGGIEKPEGEREEVGGSDGQTESGQPSPSEANKPEKKGCKKTYDECIPEVLDQYEDDAKRLVEGVKKVTDLANNPYQRIKNKVNEKLDEVEKCIEKDAGPLGSGQEIDPFEDAAEKTFETANDVEKLISGEQGKVEDLLSDPFDEPDPVGDFKVLAGLAEGLIPGIKAEKAKDQVRDLQQKRDEVVDQMDKVKNDMDKVPEITDELKGHNPSDEKSIINDVKDKIANAKHCVQMAKQQDDAPDGQANTATRDPEGVRPLNDQGEPIEDTGDMDVSESVKKARKNPTMKNISNVLDDSRDKLNLEPNKAQKQLDNLSDNVDDTISKANELKDKVKNLENNLKSIKKESTPSMKPIDKSGDKVEKSLDSLEKTIENAGDSIGVDKGETIFSQKDIINDEIKNVQKKFEGLGNAVNDTLSSACGEINKAKQLGQSLGNAVDTAADMAEKAKDEASDAIYEQMAECQNDLNRQLDKTRSKQSKITKEDTSLIKGATACLRSEFNEFQDWISDFDLESVAQELGDAVVDVAEAELAEEAWDDIKKHSEDVGKAAAVVAKSGINSIYGINKEVDQCTTAIRNCINEESKDQAETTSGMAERNQTNEKLRREDSRKVHKATKAQKQQEKAKITAKKKLKTKEELRKNLQKYQEGAPVA